MAMHLQGNELSAVQSAGWVRRRILRGRGARDGPGMQTTHGPAPCEVKVPMHCQNFALDISRCAAYLWPTRTHCTT